MSIVDVYMALNVTNKALMEQDQFKVPEIGLKNFDGKYLPEWDKCDQESRFVLLGFNPNGQVFSNGFTTAKRMRRLESEWRSHAGCRYFIISWNDYRFGN